jgi:FkbM family methyltransferase
MSITSYAQNFEDVMLWRALSHIRRGFYIDIGAQDPIVDSVSLAFYEHGWHGLHVEPTPYYAEMLRQQRPGDTIIQAAVGDGPSIIQFYEIPGSGISTADANIAAQHRERGFDVREITVPCLTLSAIFDAAAEREIHWLKIDVEGFEQQVLSTWGSSSARPWIVVVESTLPLTRIETHQKWEEILIEIGYSRVYFDGLNRYYIYEAHLALQSAFQLPPNIFDDFVLNGTANAPFHKRIEARYQKSLSDTTAQIEVQNRIKDTELERLALGERDHRGQLLATQQQAAQEIAQQLHEHVEQERLLRLQHAEHEQSLVLLLQSSQSEAQRLEEKCAQHEREHLKSINELQQLLTSTLQKEIEHEQKLHSILQGKQQELSALQIELVALRNSLSWRSTAPFRAVKRWWLRNNRGEATHTNKAIEQHISAASANKLTDLDSPHPNEVKIPPPPSEVSEMHDRSINGTLIAPPSAAATLGALLQYHDRQFVQCAYQSLLRREPDADGLQYYVHRLRAGAPKIQILSEIYASDEAKSVGLDLPGLRRAIRRQKCLRWPLIGFIFKSVIDVEGSSAVETRLRIIEQQIFVLVQHFESHSAQIEQMIEGVSELFRKKQPNSHAENTVGGHNSNSVANLSPAPGFLEPPLFSRLPTEAKAIYFKLRIAAIKFPERNE